MAIKDQSLSIKVKLIRNIGDGQRFISLAGGGKVVAEICRDNAHRAVNWTNNDGIYRIGPISKDSTWVDFCYRVKLGETIGFGDQGAFSQNLLVFNGENVLLFPYSDLSTAFDQPGNFIKELSITVTMPSNGKVPSTWKAIFPYQQKNTIGHNATLSIIKPGWDELFNLSKSCFAYGNFNVISYKGKNGSLRFFIDPSFGGRYPPEVLTGITHLYDFYAKIFGTGLYDYPVIILGKDPVTQKKIMGGIGGESLGFTFLPESAADWQSFSHSLYHAFFDNKVKARNLRYPPNLWLYRGLATYYENRSLDVLPFKLKQKYGLNANNGFRSLYLRYFYFRIKEPALFAISPVVESSLSGGQPEFVHYTLGPLLVKTIQDITKSGEPDDVLKYILERANDRSIDVEALLNTVLKDRAVEFVRDFIRGNALLPIPKTVGFREDPVKIARQLDEFELLLGTWFRTNNPYFPYDRVILYNPEKVIIETESRGIKFASTNVEKEIRNFSPTLFVLLRQYALRLCVTGEQTMDSSLRFKLLYEKQNVDKWQQFIAQKRL